MKSQGVVLVGKMWLIAVNTKGAMALCANYRHGKVLDIPPCADHVTGLGTDLVSDSWWSQGVLSILDQIGGCGILWEYLRMAPDIVLRNHSCSLIGRMHDFTRTRVKVLNYLTA